MNTATQSTNSVTSTSIYVAKCKTCSKEIEYDGGKGSNIKGISYLTLKTVVACIGHDIERKVSCLICYTLGAK